MVRIWASQEPPTETGRDDHETTNYDLLLKAEDVLKDILLIVDKEFTSASFKSLIKRKQDFFSRQTDKNLCTQTPGNCFAASQSDWNW